MANVVGDRNGECDYIRDFGLVSCRASAAAAARAERIVFSRVERVEL